MQQLTMSRSGCSEACIAWGIQTFRYHKRSSNVLAIGMQPFLKQLCRYWHPCDPQCSCRWLLVNLESIPRILQLLLQLVSLSLQVPCSRLRRSAALLAVMLQLQHGLLGSLRLLSCLAQLLLVAGLLIMHLLLQLGGTLLLSREMLLQAGVHKVE